MRKHIIISIIIIFAFFTCSHIGYSWCILPIHRVLSSGPTKKRIQAIQYAMQHHAWEEAEQECIEGLNRNEISLTHISSISENTYLHRAARATQAILQLPERFDFTPDSLFPLALFAESPKAKRHSFHSFGTYEIHYDKQSDRLFIHPGNHFLVGTGRKKTVYKTVLYNTERPQIMARGVTDTNVRHEIEAMHEVVHAPGIIQLQGTSHYRALHSGARLTNIITSLYNNGSLDSLLKKTKGALSFHQKVGIALDITQGLASLHSKGYVHRDLGARNYFVHIDENGALHTVIADLGRAMPVAKAHDVPIQGNTTYLAPESIFRDALHGKDYYKTDIFAVGTVLWHLYFGTAPRWRKHHPYKKNNKSIENQYQTFCALIEQEHNVYDKIDSGSSQKRFFQLLTSMTHPSPEKRESAEYFAQEFQALFAK